MADIDDVMDKLNDVMDKFNDVLEKCNETIAAVELDKNKYSICYHCGGDGIKSGSEDGCPDCDGTGYILDGKVSKD